MKGNRYAACPACGSRHDPARGWVAGRTSPIAPGAGDGVYHQADFLKKYGA